jgi:NitT/TauT family transport system substrate-binding protein
MKVTPGIPRRVALASLGALAFGCGKRPRGASFAIGYVNNLTNAQPLVASSRGTWARELSSELIAFPSGPSVMEALTAGSIDAGYLGPSAIVNAHVRSGGRRLRVLAGAASGGASLVARKGAPLAKTPADLRGLTVTASQIGSTPDVALRGWLHDAGVRSTDLGGDVRIVPMPNTEANELLRRGKLDAVWAQEPWASRMVAAGASRCFDERELWPNGRFPTVLLVASTKALAADPSRVAALVRLHDAETARLSSAGDSARDEVSAALAKALGKALPPKTFADAWSRFTLTTDPDEAGLARVARSMRAIGYVPEGSLDGLFAPREAA